MGYTINTMKYTGGCHCGATKYGVETDLSNVITCNCSHCAIKGLVLTFVEPEQFKLLTDESTLSVYHFNKNVIDHLFCSICGVESFARGKDKEGKTAIAINVRALKDVDLSTLTLTPVDGKSW